MIRATVSLPSLTLAEANLLKFVARAKQACADEVKYAALSIETTAKTLCPVDTGRLRSSIAADTDATDKTLTATVGTNVEYAAAIEFGAVYTKPHPRTLRARPFLFPAFAAEAPKLAGRIKSKLQDFRGGAK